MNCLRIIMYHYTRDLQHSRYADIKGLDINEFKKQISFLINNFNIIRMEELIAYYKESYELPNNAVLLTFDDGYIDNYLYAFPILNEFNIQGSFFIPGKTFVEHKLLDVNKIHYILASVSSDRLVKDLLERIEYYCGKSSEFGDRVALYNKYAVENRFDDKDTIFVKRVLQKVLPEKLRNLISSELFSKYVGLSEENLAYELYMTYDQVNILKKYGMFIGVHGYDHYWLANLDESSMQKDIDNAIDALGGFINKNSWVMNYPYGNYNKKVIDYITANGCILGLSTEVSVADLKNDNRYSLPRLDCNDFPPKSELYKMIGSLE